jgi:hypothetical protein
MRQFTHSFLCLLTLRLPWVLAVDAISKKHIRDKVLLGDNAGISQSISPIEKNKGPIRLCSGQPLGFSDSGELEIEL